MLSSRFLRVLLSNHSHSYARFGKIEKQMCVLGLCFEYRVVAHEVFDEMSERKSPTEGLEAQTL